MHRGAREPRYGLAAPDGQELRRASVLRGHDVRVGARVDQTLVAVAPLHGVRRSPVLAAHLDDLSLPGRRVDPVALDDQAVAHLCLHPSTMLRGGSSGKGPSAYVRLVKVTLLSACVAIA